MVDRDDLGFTLPAGWQLDSLTLLPGTTFLGPSGLGFIGVQAGTQVNVNPTGGSAVGLLGSWHDNPNDIGTNILPSIGLGFNRADAAGGPGLATLFRQMISKYLFSSQSVTASCHCRCSHSRVAAK